MARMKFICDAERCIECNSCVTACKAEHDVPWGVNRRRVVTLNDGVPGETLDLGRLHALQRRAVHGGLPGRLLLPHRGRRGAARQGHLHRLRLLLLRLPVRRAAVPEQRHLRPARQDGQVHLLRRRPRGQRQRGREREVRPQPAGRGQAADLRRDVLDQGAARRRRRPGVADIFRTRVLHRGKGSEVWGWGTAYGKPSGGALPQQAGKGGAKS